jgi:hypothetical protein
MQYYSAMIMMDITPICMVDILVIAAATTTMILSGGRTLHTQMRMILMKYKAAEGMGWD